MHRKILTPAFHFNILEKFVDIFNEKGKTLIKLLKEEADKDSFNIFPFVNLYAFDAILGNKLVQIWNHETVAFDTKPRNLHGNAVQLPGGEEQSLRKSDTQVVIRS